MQYLIVVKYRQLPDSILVGKDGVECAGKAMMAPTQ